MPLQIPEGYHLLPGEKFSPLQKGDIIKKGYFAGDDEPEISPDRKDDPNIRWWNTNKNVNQIFKRVRNTPDGPFAWVPDPTWTKFVLDESDTVIGKVIKDPEAESTKKLFQFEDIDPNITFSEAVDAARQKKKQHSAS